MDKRLERSLVSAKTRITDKIEKLTTEISALKVQLEEIESLLPEEIPAVLKTVAKGA